MKIADSLSLPLKTVTEKLAFLGRTGSGKTYAAMKLAELMLDHEAQIVALDPVGAWHGLRIGGQWGVYIFGGLRGDLPLESTGGKLMADLVTDRGVSAVLDISQFIRSEQVRFASDFIERFFNRKKAAPSAVHVFLEECQEFAPQNPGPNEAHMLHHFERMWKLGRGFGIGGSLVSQRPQEINKKVLNQSGTLFVFNMTGPQERKAIAEWTRQAGIDEDIESVLPTLKVGEPHVWSPQFLKVSKTVKILPKITADVSSTPEVGARAKEKPLSPIDVETLKSQMAATVERAKADDPKELRKQIADLKRQLASINKTETKVEVKEVSMLTDADRETMRLLSESLRAAAIVVQGFEAHSKAAVHMLEKVSGKSNAPVKFVPTQERRPVQQPRRPTVAPKDASDERIPVGELKILTACGQYPDGATREQLTILTGYKRSSRDAYIARLIPRGFVETRGSDVMITDAGLAALGPDFEPLPTGRDLQEYWLERLPVGEGAMLRILIDAGGDPVDREKLTEETGYKRSSRDAYLQRLSARQLVINDGRGQVRAADALFEETT